MLVYILLAIYLVCLYVAYKGALVEEGNEIWRKTIFSGIQVGMEIRFPLHHTAPFNGYNVGVVVSIDEKKGTLVYQFQYLGFTLKRTATKDHQFEFLYYPNSNLCQLKQVK